MRLDSINCGTFFYLFFGLKSCRFTDVKIGKPSMVVDAISEQITPHMCRLSDTTYVAIHVLFSFLIDFFFSWFFSYVPFF